MYLNQTMNDNVHGITQFTLKHDVITPAEFHFNQVFSDLMQQFFRCFSKDVYLLQKADTFDRFHHLSIKEFFDQVMVTIIGIPGDQFPEEARDKQLSAENHSQDTKIK